MFSRVDLPGGLERDTFERDDLPVLAGEHLPEIGHGHGRHGSSLLSVVRR
jgi:hypothetical protein